VIERDLQVQQECVRKKTIMAVVLTAARTTRTAEPTDRTSLPVAGNVGNPEASPERVPLPHRMKVKTTDDRRARARPPGSTRD
jgi:hypothetical protein